MSQNIYYSEWTGELGLYRIEFYPADTEVLDEPVYVELPEEIVTVESYNNEFDKLPIGLAKSPVLKLKVQLFQAIEFSTEFRDMFVNSTKVLEYGNILSGGVREIVAGTVIKMYMPPNLNEYFVGIIRDDVDVDIDMTTGEISIEAQHWMKIALDSSGFEGFEALAVLSNWIDYSVGIYELYFEHAPPYFYGLFQKNDNTRFGFIKLGQIFTYISLQVTYIRKVLLREADLIATTVPFADVRHYRQNYTSDYLALGDELPIADVCVLASIENSDGTARYGGLIYDHQSGIRRYKSAWDFLSDYYESTLVRVYIADGDRLAIRTLFGRYGQDLNLASVDSDALIGGKLKLNAMKLTSVTSSIQGSVSGDVSKYESSRPTSRNAHEFTIPIVFGNVPPAADWKKSGNVYAWKAFDPHVWGLYYKEGMTHYKVHHYCEYQLSRLKWSSVYPDCQYSGTIESADALSELLLSNPKAGIAVLQSESGNAKWCADTLRNAYDRQQQSMLEDIEFLPLGYEFEEPFIYYFAFDFGEISAGLDLADAVYLPIGYEFDYQTEKLKLTLISVDGNAI